MFLGVRQTSKGSASPSLDDFFPADYYMHIFLMSNVALPCYISNPLCDIENKFPAIFQQPFHYFRTDIHFLRPALSLFLIHVNSFLDLLSLLVFSHQNSLVFADRQHPKVGTLFPSDVLHKGKGLLHACHEIRSSLSILG